MTKQKQTTATDQDDVERTGFRWSVWTVFLAVVVISLVADLGLKYWAFNNVDENFQYHVQTAEEGGPEVLVRVSKDRDWLVAHEVGMATSPDRVPGHAPIVVVPNLLNFQLTLNTGAVFGTGQGGRPVFIVVSIVALVVILFLIYRSPPKARVYHFGLALILGGALGNLYDRVLYSAVRDMLHMLPDQQLPFGLAYPWGGTDIFPYIFNIADVSLLAGVGLVLVVSWLAEMKQAKAKKTP
ncbi:MAG: signal peptidase II [Phycisphaeraceae bacterium]